MFVLFLCCANPSGHQPPAILLPLIIRHKLQYTLIKSHTCVMYRTFQISSFYISLQSDEKISYFMIKPPVKSWCSSVGRLVCLSLVGWSVVQHFLLRRKITLPWSYRSYPWHLFYFCKVFRCAQTILLTGFKTVTSKIVPFFQSEFFLETFFFH